ncbi:DNA repair-related protein [Trichosporon asahii var. asahii CBS 8904]|uniref:Non-structural maintenance of chromosomes element 1 homolog n=2 Tax=Trichosporon asahii var. asahii TaxID=189963 RepID=K1V527_TRIAC|nr:DNA repair-related protein [Trichosporon asahii var. asahii CBS 8904]
MEGLSTFLEEASTLLEPFGMRIKRAKSDDGVGWVVLANDETGDIGRMATDLSSLEISYFRALLEAIMLSHPANSVSNAQALRLTTDLKGNMSKRDAETLLGALTSRGWLAKSKRGRYTLAPRAMIELDSYLREQYEDEGVICANPECEAHYHTYCYEQIKQAGRDKCAACQTRFSENEPRPLGELSVPRREDQWGTLNNRRKRRERDDEDEIEDEEEEQELDSEEEVEVSTRSVVSGPVSTPATTSNVALRP